MARRSVKAPGKNGEGSLDEILTEVLQLIPKELPADAEDLLGSDESTPESEGK